jgi:nitric oxide dioxygenase
MDAEQIDLVQKSFAKVAPIADQAARLFYGRLFELAPQVKPLFKRDIDEQGRMLMGALSTVVNGLKDLDVIVPIAQQLAVRHVSYGVKAEYYQPVGEALLWTLEKGLGPDFTPPVKAAWTQAYTTLSGVMIAVAYPQKAAE